MKNPPAHPAQVFGDGDPTRGFGPEPVYTAETGRRGRLSAADRDYRRSHARASSAAAPLRVLAPETWEGKPVPTTRWIVERVIPALAVCTLGGHGETGKSLLALQLGVARALGRDWLGFSTSRGKTLVIACEDPEEQIHARIAGILRHYNATFAELGDRLRVIDRNDMINAMMEWESRWAAGEETALYSQTMNLAIDTGADLIVIDSRYDVFPGEQSDTPQVHAFMGAMRTMATEIDGAVLLLSHPSRTGLENGDGESGSVAWHNKVRSRLYLRQADPERDGDAERVLEHPKSNWGPKADPLPLRWVNGAFAADRPATGILASIEQGTTEQLFLEALGKLTARGATVSATPTANNFAPTAMIKAGLVGRTSKRALRGAMEALLTSNRITVHQYGRPSDPRFKLVEVTP